MGSLPQSGRRSAQNSRRLRAEAQMELWALLKIKTQQFIAFRQLVYCYSGLEMTPQAIRGGAPLSVELLTACTTMAVPALLKTE